MTKFSVTVTFTVIFSLFLLSHARIPLNQPSNLVAEYKLDDNNKEPLPSEGSESLPVETVDLPSSDADAIRAIGINRPLTITFDVGHHPFNRHVHHLHMKHPFWFRRLPHRCRHHASQGPREISYGNDMIFSSSQRVPDLVDEKPFDKPMARPYKVNELTRKDFDEFLASGVFTKEDVFEKQGYVDGKVFFTPLDMEYEKPMEKKKKEGGLMKKVRKFLNRFDF